MIQMYMTECLWLEVEIQLFDWGSTSFFLEVTSGLTSIGVESFSLVASEVSTFTCFLGGSLDSSERKYIYILYVHAIKSTNLQRAMHENINFYFIA